MKHWQQWLVSIAAMVASMQAAIAADVTVTPAASSGFVVKNAAGSAERLRVNEDGTIAIPALASQPQQSTSICVSAAGLLGPCSPVGGSYAAGTGLALAGTTFSVAPTYQLPQGCSSTQIAQWSGSAWACASASSGATLPAGTYEQTVRYNSSNTLVANNMLLAFADGGLLATGSFGVGTIPETGAGTRMMWYPGKQAFRAGSVGGTEWDDANVGANSIALGHNTKASGGNSTALGATTTASGSAAFASGAATTASGGQAVAMGDTTTASGTDSTALGFTTNANGDFSTAMGSNTTAAHDYSVAIGDHAVTGGKNSFVFGDGSAAPAQVTGGPDRSFYVFASGGIKLSGPTTITNGATIDGGETLNSGPLVVNGNGPAPYTYYAYFTADPAEHPNTGPCAPCATSPVAIDTTNGGVIMAPEFDATSDARIKDITGLSNSARDLVTLNEIEITNYTMKDKIAHGNVRFKKVIAQQVEKVYPQIVSQHTDFIPDVYRVADTVEAVEGGYKLSFDTPHGLPKTAKRLRLLPAGRSAFAQVDVIAIPSDRDVIVQASGWTAEHVFVYGEEVDDLRTVDYDGLTALNVSATQELSKRLGVQQERQSQLVVQGTDRDAQIIELRNRLAAQEKQLAAQRDELTGQRARIAALLAQKDEIAALAAAVRGLQHKQFEPLLTTASARP